MKKGMILVSGVLLLAACQKREYVGPNGEKVVVDSGSKNVTVTTKDGSAVFAGGAGTVVPENFPKDIPIYTGGKVTGAVSGAQQGSSGQMVTFETPDSPEKVIDFYKGKLTGWANSMEMASGNGKMLVLVSPDQKRTVSVTATPAGGKTSVSLTVGAKS